MLTNSCTVWYGGSIIITQKHKFKSGCLLPLSPKLLNGVRDKTQDFYPINHETEITFKCVLRNRKRQAETS